MEAILSLRRQLRVLLDHQAIIKDERQSWKVAYPLPEVLFLVVCGTIASGDDTMTSSIGAKRICRCCGASWSFTTAIHALTGCARS
jgi:hypothetical protein